MSDPLKMLMELIPTVNQYLLFEPRQGDSSFLRPWSLKTAYNNSPNEIQCFDDDYFLSSDK